METICTRKLAFVPFLSRRIQFRVHFTFQLCRLTCKHLCRERPQWMCAWMRLANATPVFSLYLCVLVDISVSDACHALSTRRVSLKDPFTLCHLNYPESSQLFSLRGKKSPPACPPSQELACLISSSLFVNLSLAS